MAKYISDQIGNEFKEWGKNEVEFITAPTGSGKTSFVLNQLVEYAAIRGEKILYLVNRTVLKEQIVHKIDTVIKHKLRRNPNIQNDNIERVIRVVTYQEIESYLKSSIDTLENWGTFRYIIADECHYFLVDSLFNTSTEISYNWLKEQRKKSTIVFMSATIFNIQKYIIKDYSLKFYENKKGASVVRGDVEIQGWYRNYEGEADFSWINLIGLNRIETIPELVKKSSGKWLIFVDSIERGKDIQQLLDETGIENRFIEARTKYDEDIKEDFQEIVQKEKFRKKVLIATSVLDNGVNIVDYELRNMVIMADTQEEFIQMLGRKRLLDEEKQNQDMLNLYILPKGEKEFRKKQTYFLDKIKFISTENIEDDTGVVLEKIIQSKQYYKNARLFGYVQEDSLHWNRLSIEECDCLFEYYSKILEEFQKNNDENIFLKKQAKWLEQPEEKIREVVSMAMENKKDIFRRTLNEAIEKIQVENPEGMDKKSFSIWKAEHREFLWYFMENQEGITENDKQYLGQTDRPLTVKKFEICMKNAKLPYYIEKTGEKEETRYKIRKISE